MSQSIEIIITPEGKTTVQTLGFRGASCQAASQFIEEALGKRTGAYRTAEFYQAQSTTHVEGEQTY